MLLLAATASNSLLQQYSMYAKWFLIVKDRTGSSQARWKELGPETLKATCQNKTQLTLLLSIDLSHRAVKKVVLPGIEPRTSGFSRQCSSH